MGLRGPHALWGCNLNDQRWRQASRWQGENFLWRYVEERERAPTRSRGFADVFRQSRLTGELS